MYVYFIYIYIKILQNVQILTHFLYVNFILNNKMREKEEEREEEEKVQIKIFIIKYYFL